MSIFYHKKSLGQNFLHNKKILEKICRIQDLNNKHVVEVGPGKGFLTEFLLKENPKNLTVIEKDKRLKPFLEKIKKRYPNKLHILFDDALKLDLTNLTKNKIILVGNLPYNIATTLILNWIRLNKNITSLVLMIQKEVAQRLYAKAGTSFYSRISVLIQANATVTEKIEVSSENFFPKPKVNSAVVEIIPYKRNFDYDNLDKTLKICFLHRRKILRNNLKNLSEENKVKIYESGVNLSLRPQDLNHKEYIKLSKILFS